MLSKPTVDNLPKEPLARLLAVMAWLRDRQHGCPWDIDQTFKTIAPYTIEEAYEVADAIERDDMPALKEELGDLLLQVVYHAQMASETKAFDFADVAAAIARSRSPCDGCVSDVSCKIVSLSASASACACSSSLLICFFSESERWACVRARPR